MGKLQAAVAAWTDPSAVIVAHTNALAECPLQEGMSPEPGILHTWSGIDLAQ